MLTRTFKYSEAKGHFSTVRQHTRKTHGTLRHLGKGWTLYNEIKNRLKPSCVILKTLS